MRRAREDWQKEERSRAILGVAERLFVEQGGKLPAVDSVARETGIAKGTVYLYFPAREAIFLSLLEWHACHWIDNVLHRIGGLNPRPPAADIVDAILAYPLSRPVVLDLASLSGTVLEANVDFDTAFRFKSGLTRRLLGLGRAVEEKYTGMEPGTAARCALRTYSYLIGLRQVAEPPAILQEVRRREGFELFRIDYEMEAREGLLALWQHILGNRGGTLKSVN